MATLLLSCGLNIIPAQINEKIISSNEVDKLTSFEGNEDLLNQKILVIFPKGYRLSFTDGLPKKWITKASNKNDYINSDAYVVERDSQNIRNYRITGCVDLYKYEFLNQDAAEKFAKRLNVSMNEFYVPNTNFKMAQLLNECRCDKKSVRCTDHVYVLKNRLSLNICDFLYREVTDRMFTIDNMSDAIGLYETMHSNPDMLESMIKQMNVRGSMKYLIPFVCDLNHFTTRWSYDRSDIEQKLRGFKRVLIHNFGECFIASYNWNNMNISEKYERLNSIIRVSGFEYTEQEIDELRTIIK